MMSNHLQNEPLIIIVILNTNRREDTLAALESVERNSYPNFKIIVLDNASTDGSKEAIRQHYPAVQVVSLEDNLGYAGNNNAGIEIAIQQGADWILILNEDTILAQDCLSILISEACKYEHVGILGPLVYHFDEKKVIQTAGGKMNDLWDAWHVGQNEQDHGQYVTPRQVDWISGCAILVRKKVFDQIGLLDAGFFYYWEETEFCLRARLNDWDILQVPAAKIWHKGVQRDYRPGPNVTYYNTRNHLLMMKKHHAPLKAWIHNYFQLLRIFLSWSVKPEHQSQHEHREALLQGFLDFKYNRPGKRLEKKVLRQSDSKLS